MTPAARRVLKELAEDEDRDLVLEGRFAYCGDRRTTSQVVYELLSMTAVKVAWTEGASATYYVINETGRALLRRPELEGELAAAWGKGSFSIINDKVVRI